LQIKKRFKPIFELYRYFYCNKTGNAATGPENNKKLKGGEHKEGKKKIKNIIKRARYDKGA